MSDTDKYLSRLDNIGKKKSNGWGERAKELRQIYKGYYPTKGINRVSEELLERENLLREDQSEEQKERVLRKLGTEGIDFDLSKKERIEKYLPRLRDRFKKDELAIRAYAKSLMDGALGNIKENTMDTPEEHIYRALWGAELSEQLGKGKKAIPKLSKVLEKYKDYVSEKDNQDAKAFVKRNTEERQPSLSGIEKRTLAFIGTTFAGIALSAFSLQSTGNAIGNLTGTTQGLLGIFLFIVGIAGLVFSRK